MKKNVNVVGDYTCDQFYQIRVCTERDDCAECLQLSIVVHVFDQLRK